MATITKSTNPKSRKPYTVRYWHENRQRETSFVTRREAADFVAKFEHDRRANIFVDPKAGAETFGDAAERWIGTKRAAARRKYDGVLRNHMASLMARKLRDVANDRDGIEALCRDHSQGTIMLVVVRQTCQSAVNAGRLTSHRLGGLKSNHVTGVRDLVSATPEQINAVADALGADGLAVHLMRGLGLRAAEALALRESDFMINGMVRVSRQIQNGQIVPLKHRKSFADGRDIPVAPSLARMVREHGVQGPDGQLFGTGYSTFLHRFMRVAKATGLPAGFTPHQLRHAFASALLPAGVAITDVARWMGHADTRETSRVYAHLLPGQADRARSLLEAQLHAADNDAQGVA